MHHLIVPNSRADVNWRWLQLSTPGSENAVKLAMEKLILPELGHILQQLSK
jgi:molybdopterin biosynthesis enzyme MoaB